MGMWEINGQKIHCQKEGGGPHEGQSEPRDGLEQDARQQEGIEREGYCLECACEVKEGCTKERKGEMTSLALCPAVYQRKLVLVHEDQPYAGLLHGTSIGSSCRDWGRQRRVGYQVGKQRLRFLFGVVSTNKVAWTAVSFLVSVTTSEVFWSLCSFLPSSLGV